MIMLFGDGTAVMTTDAGQEVRLSKDDIEAIKMAFPGECEACGYDPMDEGWLGDDPDEEDDW